MSDVKDFHDGVESLLENDATYQTEIAALLGSVPTVIHGNRPPAQIPDHKLPAVVMEAGDGEQAALTEGDDEAMTVGGQFQGFATVVFLSFVWHQRDVEAAYDQRMELPGIVARLFLRNPAPGNIAGARLTDWEPDRGVNHPTQIWQGQVLGAIEIERS